MDIKERLIECRTNAGLSRQKAADLLGVSASVLTKWERGERQPRYEMLARLAEFYGVSVGTLMGEQEAQTNGTVAVPILGEVAAGYPMFAQENILGYEDISADMATQGEYFALRVKGDSMLPRMREGDIVIVRRQPTCDDGQTAVVLVNGEAATVKKVQKREDGLMLIPTNPDFAPMFYSARSVQTLPVTIIGVVVELRAKYV